MGDRAKVRKPPTRREEPNAAQQRAEQRGRFFATLVFVFAVAGAVVTALTLIDRLPAPRSCFYVLLIVAGLALLIARIADRFGRHRLFQLGVGAFFVALVAGALVGWVDRPVPAAEYAPERLARIPTGNAPRAIAASRDDVWVVGVDGIKAKGRLWRIDPRQLSSDAEVIDSFKAVEPFDIAIDERAIWVTDRGWLIKLNLDGREIWRERFSLGGNNEVDVGFGHVWYKQTEPGRLLMLAPSSGRILDSVKIGPQAVALGVGLGAVWVTKKGGAPKLVRIDPNGDVVGRIEVQGDPQDVATGKRYVYVAHALGNRLTRVDPDPEAGGPGRELPGDIPLGGELPGGLAAGDRTVWVPFAHSNNVFAVDDCDTSVLGEATSGAEPYDVVVYRKRAFVPNVEGGTVSVFKLRKPLAPCPEDSRPGIGPPSQLGLR